MSSAIVNGMLFFFELVVGVLFSTWCQIARFRFLGALDVRYLKQKLGVFD